MKGGTTQSVTRRPLRPIIQYCSKHAKQIAAMFRQLQEMGRVKRAERQFSAAHGYTIVETLIFLAVSAALFAAIYSTFAGRQSKAEFNYGIRDFATQIQDIVNDVSTGNYSNVGNYTCNTSSGEPRFIGSGATNNQGANKDCIFVGRVIQFAPSDGLARPSRYEVYRVYSVAGSRKEGGVNSNEVGSLLQSKTVPVAPLYGYNSSQDYILPNGIEVKWIRYDNGAGLTPSVPNSLGMVGFFTNFASYGNSNLLNSDSRSADIIPIHGSNLLQNINDAARNIHDDTTVIAPNPANGVVVCAESASGGYYALINIGANKRQLTSDFNIKNGQCT